jgi:peptidoglycan pentaglycine glycine transferase (the first glycine)
MEIKEINNKDIWENFFLDCSEKTFLQSWNWGEFQKKIGDKIWRWGIYKENHLIGLALVIKIAAKRGTFLFCPHGPIFKKQEEKKQILGVLLEKLKKTAREEGTVFIRISPIWEKNKKNTIIFRELGFIEASIHIHPELTWELNIASSEEELLMQMRKTTRYLIRQAQKNAEVIIEKSQKIEDIEAFNELYQATVDRHHFTPFSLDYLKNEFLVFNQDNQSVIFLGKYKGELIASAVIIFWQGAAFYHQGASSMKYPKIPVSYLLQWEAIKEAKKRGSKIYNFWGIAPTDSLRHAWAGLSLFKKGFGGYKKEYVKTQDLPLSPKYFINYLVESLRKIKRGF